MGVRAEPESLWPRSPGAGSPLPGGRVDLNAAASGSTDSGSAIAPEGRSFGIIDFHHRPLGRLGCLSRGGSGALAVPFHLLEAGAHMRGNGAARHLDGDHRRPALEKREQQHAQHMQILVVIVRGLGSCSSSAARPRRSTAGCPERCPPAPPQPSRRSPPAGRPASPW